MKTINNETIIKGMRVIFDNKNAGYERTLAALDEEHIDWDFNDAEKYALKNPSGEMSLSKGLLTGNMSFGVTMIANARAGRMNYSYISEWLFDEPGVPCVGEWLRQANK